MSVGWRRNGNEYCIDANCEGEEQHKSDWHQNKTEAEVLNELKRRAAAKEWRDSSQNIHLSAAAPKKKKKKIHSHSAMKFHLINRIITHRERLRWTVSLGDCR